MFHCDHCGNEFPYAQVRNIKPSYGRTWKTCPTCKFGALTRMKKNIFGVWQVQNPKRY